MEKSFYERALLQSVRLKSTKYEQAAALIAFSLMNGKKPSKKIIAFIENLEAVKV